MLREVHLYVTDAWIDRETLDEQDGGIGKVGYEINFNRVFFQYQPPRPLHEIDAELAEVEGDSGLAARGDGVSVDRRADELFSRARKYLQRWAR